MAILHVEITDICAYLLDYCVNGVNNRDVCCQCLTFDSKPTNHKHLKNRISYRTRATTSQILQLPDRKNPLRSESRHNLCCLIKYHHYLNPAILISVHCAVFDRILFTKLLILLPHLLFTPNLTTATHYTSIYQILR